MFSERRYARYDNDYDRRPTSALTWLLCALAAGYVIEMVFAYLIPGAATIPFDAAAFSPDALRGLRLWTLASYTLLHASLLHLIFNSLVIYFMGREVLPLLGNKRFAAVALAAAVGGALLWFAVNRNAASTQLIGASSIAVAFVVLFACFNPNTPTPVLLFFIIPVVIRPKYIAAIVIALDLLGLVFFEILGGRDTPNIAYSAHLGGALAAFAYFLLVHRREWLNPDGAVPGVLPGWLLRKKKPASIASPKYKVNMTSAPASTPSRESLRAEVDRILDKINAQGFASLSEDERRTLDSAKDVLSAAQNAP